MNKKQIFLKAFEGYEAEKPPVRVKINGNFIKTCTGKAGWQTVAHAKSALRHHLSFRMGYDEMEKLVGEGSSRQRAEQWGKLLEEMMKDGTVEFEGDPTQTNPLEEENASLRACLKDFLGAFQDESDSAWCRAIFERGRAFER